MKYLPGCTIVFASFVLAVVVGCGGGGGEGPSVKGKVTLDGTPLPDARVTLQAGGQGLMSGAMATTNANGEFSIVPDPAIAPLKPGTYVVVISKKVDKQGNVPDFEMYGQLEAAGELRETIPAQYSTAQSKLKATIEEGDNVLEEFALTSK